MRYLRLLIAGSVFAWALGAPARALEGGSPFDRLVENWQRIHDYSVTIDAREELGTRSDENELRYAFLKPDHARLDVVRGRKSGSTIVWNGGNGVIAYRRSMSFLKMHGTFDDKDLTSLRGNSVRSPDLGRVLACFGNHREQLEERDGPLVGGEPTSEVSLPYKDVVCPDDPPADRGAVTRDVLDISLRTGMIVARVRYAGDDAVERWSLKDYVIDAGLTDAQLK